jgi:CheY-like chemotaxis protein
MRLEPERLHAQTLVFNCISSLTGNAVRKDIDIKILIKDSLYIRVDERLLTLVITNLLSNAIKFSREGQTVEIFADAFNDKFIEFVIKDEGIGISETNKSKLFKIEKMYTTEGTKGERGTGLGLSLVKEIIEKHGGEIWFYSEQSKGSEFHFTVPSFPNTILLIENNKEDRKIFEKMIRTNFPNYDVLGVPNGYEALGLVYRYFPSLIITENDMPLMSGIQFVESIRREDRGHKIPIIALAPEVTNELKLAYQNFGINTILQKPVAEEVFNEKIQTVLDYSS